MTDADKPMFVQLLARLAVAHREKERDVVQMRVYFDVLKASEIEFVVDAAERLMGGEFFSRAGAWLTASRRPTPAASRPARNASQNACQADPMQSLIGRWPLPRDADAVRRALHGLIATAGLLR
jgi:hypothetical protein